jgi:hypothetical protein
MERLKLVLTQCGEISLFQGTYMPEKTEWEVVDGPAPSARPTLQQLMQTVMGPWWRWKLAGAAVVAIMALVFFATIVGVFMLVLPAVALVALAIRKMTQWMRHGSGSGSLSNARQNSRPEQHRRFHE